MGIVVIGFLVRTWFTSEKGKRVWEGLVLKTPLVGPLIAQFAMARFCRMLGTLIGAGVPLVHGLNVARRSIGNQILVDAVGQSIERVQQGGRLGQSLADCKILFSGSTLEMISVAEESGKLDGELVRIAVVTEVGLGPQSEDRRGVCRAGDAVFDRRLHRHHFHRHVAAGVDHEPRKSNKNSTTDKL